MTLERHILIVEDEKDTRDLLDYMVHEIDEGFAINSVESAEDALDLIENQTFDLYVLDYKLPRMTGVELCSRIRQIDEKAPIIFFTALEHWMDKRAALKAGATEYLTKPKDLDRFRETVQRLINEDKTGV